MASLDQHRISPLLLGITYPQVQEGSVLIVALAGHLFGGPFIHLQQGEGLALVCGCVMNSCTNF